MIPIDYLVAFMLFFLFALIASGSLTAIIAKEKGYNGAGKLIVWFIAGSLLPWVGAVFLAIAPYKKQAGQQKKGLKESPKWVFLAVGIYPFLFVFCLLMVGVTDYKVMSSDRHLVEPQHEQFATVEKPTGQQKLTEVNSGIESAVFVACQNEMEKKLVSPGSADFAYPSEMKTNPEKTAYFIKSYVDAQNSYGAKLRKDFACLAKLKEGANPNETKSWQIKKIAID